MLKLLRNKKGLTLIEVIMSLAILTMVLIPLSSLFFSTVKINNTSNQQMIASQLAQEYMEKIKGAIGIEPYINGDLNSDGVMIYNIGKDGKNYYVKTTITNIPGEYSKTIGRDLPQANLVINQLNSNNVLLIDTSDIYLNGIPNMCQVAAVDEIVIFIYFREERNITVSNTSGKTANIYLIKEVGSLVEDINVNITEGNINVIKNAVDNSAFDTNEKTGYTNWIYQITVEVYKASDNGQILAENKLTELKSLKRMN